MSEARALLMAKGMVKALVSMVLVSGQLAQADSRVPVAVAVADPAAPAATDDDTFAPVIDKATLEPTPFATTLHHMRDDDAASDRAFGRGTAIALDAGQFDLSIRSAIQHGSMLSTAGGVGHGIELSVSVGYGRQLGTDYGFGAKFQLVDHEDFAFAIDTSINSLKEHPDSSYSETLWSVDARFTRVTRGVVASAAIGFLKVPTDDIPVPLPFVDGSLLLGSGPVRPMLEVFSFFGVFNMGFAGVRVGGRHVAFDAGVGYAGSADQNDQDQGVALMVGLGVRP